MILFAGPSLTEQSKQLITADIEHRPPVVRGDIEALTASNFQGTIGIVDGYFNQNLAVGHAEIREAIKKGCTIYGLSSMGAIRAYEMQISGMKGYGKVYNWFFTEEDFQDDEVALLHSEGPEYIAVSEPLIHFRACIQFLINQKILNNSEGDTIIKTLKSLYYGKRTRLLFYKLLSTFNKVDINWIKSNFRLFRIKQLDLEYFLASRIWE